MLIINFSTVVLIYGFIICTINGRDKMLSCVHQSHRTAEGAKLESFINWIQLKFSTSTPGLQRYLNEVKRHEEERVTEEKSKIVRLAFRLKETRMVTVMPKIQKPPWIFEHIRFG